MFKVGQKVWCVIHGEGKVVDIASRSDCIVGVEFLIGTVEYYTKSGSLRSQGNRTLFFSPPIVSAEIEPPFVPTLVGKMVAIQDNRDGHILTRKIVQETVDEIYISPDSFFFKKNVTVYELTPVTFED